MKLVEKIPKRKFIVGNNSDITISDCAEIYLNEDEQVTFKDSQLSEIDIAKKDFGYYLSPSLNKRLVNFKLKTYLTKNKKDLFYILCVHQGKEASFEAYLTREEMTVVCCLSEGSQLGRIMKEFIGV